MATRKRIFASERDMHLEWAASAGRSFRSSEGTRVRVVYPGIHAGSDGPDFKGAVLALPREGVVCGDVELHLRAVDWSRHGHHVDHAYDRVVLHVVGDVQAAAATTLADGSEVVTVSMGDRHGPLPAHGLPCRRWVESGSGETGPALARLGVARMLQRAAGLAGELASEQAWVVLARRVARALGYAANSDTSMELAALLTSFFGGVPLEGADDDERRALLLGVAGLLPSQRRRAGLVVHGDMPLWETLWSRLGAGVPSLDVGRWRLSGLYPNNSPVRRVIALADLWPGLPRLAEVAAGAAAEPRIGSDILERSCRVAGDGFWRRHYDFGLRTRESALVGGAKAREIVVNALLPYAAACTMLSGDAPGTSRVAGLLCSYGPSPENAVTRHLGRQLSLPSRTGGAAVQQGMMHLFGHYCSRGLCVSCPLGREPSPVERAAS